MQRLGKATVALLGVTLACSTALAALVNTDAGTGTDAGDTLGAALALPGYGDYTGVLPLLDADWYSLDDAQSSPRCVATTAAPGATSNVTLRLDNGAATRTITQRPTGGSTWVGALALPSLQRSYTGFTDPVADMTYKFSLRAHSIPSLSDGDAGTGGDAGGSRSTATPVTSGCLGGHIGLVNGLEDRRDYYSFTAKAGDIVYYSLAATGNATLQVLDASGNVLGHTLNSGEAAGVEVPSDGTYFLLTSSKDSVDVGYTTGLTIGPDPPGSGCRPYCFISS